MKRLVTVSAGLLVAVGVVGCGGGSSSSTSSSGSVASNQEKIEANAASEQSAPGREQELLKILRAGLGAFDEKDVGVENVYEVPGGICNVTGIYTSTKDVEAEGQSPNGLVSPEGDAVVTVNYMIDPNSEGDATLAECQKAALVALGWGEGEEPESPSSAGDITKAEWIAQADEICKAGNEAIEPYEEKADAMDGEEVESDPQGTFEKLAELTDEIPVVAKPFYEELRALQVPNSEVEVIDEVIVAIESQVSYAPRLSDALREGDVAKIEEVAEEANVNKERAHGFERGFGLKVCGGDSE